MMFLSIHVEIDPQRIRRTEGWFCKTRSHHTFSLGAKVGSFEPIQEISSKRITVGFFERCLERWLKALLQSAQENGGRWNSVANWRVKASLWSCAVMPRTGASPLKGKNSLFFPNSSARRLFPILRRPFMTARQALPDWDRSSSLCNSISLPTNGFMFFMIHKQDV